MTALLEGIDVSSHQGTTPPLAGLAFLAARATYGTRPDAVYDAHARAARAAGLALIAYHFGTSATSGRTQAAAFLAATAAVRPDRYALDLERESGRVPMSLATAREFIAAVHATGRRVTLYHSESLFPDVGQDSNWIANWSNTPTHPWLFWQYRGGPLDRDRFHGTRLELQPPTAPAGALWRVHFPVGTYRTARVSSGRFLGYGEPFTTRGMTAWAGRPIVLVHNGVRTTWFRILNGGRAGLWCYRYDPRLAWSHP